MLKTKLVKESVEDGERLVAMLEEQSFPITAALWFYFQEEMLWRFFLVSPAVESEGPLRTYMRIMEALDRLRGYVRLSVSDISVISPNWAQFQDLRRQIEDMRRMGHIRSSGQSGCLPGVDFEDAYVYRWEPT